MGISPFFPVIIVFRVFFAGYLVQEEALSPRRSYRWPSQKATTIVVASRSIHTNRRQCVAVRSCPSAILGAAVRGLSDD